MVVLLLMAKHTSYRSRIHLSQLFRFAEPSLNQPKRHNTYEENNENFSL